MNSKKQKIFSSAKEVFKTYLPNSVEGKDISSDEHYMRNDCDFPKRLADNFRSVVEGKKVR
jgi:hypothetical protein